MVRAEGLEPSRGLRPNGFSYPLRLSPPCRKARARDAPPGLWSGLYLHHDRSVWGRSAGRCCPSSLYTFPCGVLRRGLARDRHSQGSPNLSSSASPVSRRALKLRLSPMRLPIPPRPRGHFKYKAHATLRVSFAIALATFFLQIILMAAVSRRVLM
jgi:hypothetical protein